LIHSQQQEIRLKGLINKSTVVLKENVKVGKKCNE